MKIIDRFEIEHEAPFHDFVELQLDSEAGTATIKVVNNPAGGRAKITVPLSWLAFNVSVAAERSKS